MSTTAIRSKDATDDTRVGQVDLKLEVVIIPVSDLDRAKEFYGRLGWRLDGDFSHGRERAVQFTPPGSQCSIIFGTNVTSAVPGSAQGLFLIVSDIEAARDELMRRGVEVGEVFHYAAGPAPFGGQVRGTAPDHVSYGSYAKFSDPDGNGWVLQEVTTRFPGRNGRRHDVRVGGRPGAGIAARGGRARPAREADGPAGRELAGLVRRVHGAGAERRRAAALTE